MVLKLTTKLVWRGLAPAYASMKGAPEPVDDALLDEVEATVRSTLTAMPQFVSRTFALPEGLRAFYLAAQSTLQPIGREAAFSFYACTWLATDGLSLADEARGDSTPWLEIGSFAPNHWVFVCCDTEDELYGAIVERTDSTPWSRMVYPDEVWPDMEAFLKSLYP